MPNVALSCSGLVKRFADVVAVDGLDLSVERGECFGLLGPNGAGKTTTVEILEGLLEPTAGEVTVLGERWGRDDLALRARLGIQLQETRFPEKLKVKEILKVFASFYPSGASGDDALAAVGLEEKANAFVRTLSGGQKQRLSLACALVGDPEVLFLDEPTTGLDPSSRRQLWDVVEAFKARGRTVLLTTHYMEEAERLCDRVGVVDHGKLLALGTPGELVASLGAEHIVELEVTGAIDDAALLALPGVERVDRVGRTRPAGHPAHENGDAAEPVVLRLTVRAVHLAVPPLLALLAVHRLEARRLTTHHATLEDVFLHLAGHRLEGG